jgi:dynein heavy chain
VLVEGNLAAPNVESVEAMLTKSLVLCIKQLEELSVLVRGELLPLDRKILTALITIDVHARDIVDDMVR